MGLTSCILKFAAPVPKITRYEKYLFIGPHPDDIEIGKQYVEVVFDVDGFTHNGFYYQPLKEQVSKYMIYGLLPNNCYIYGKQYTFHIGLDLSSVYHKITFAPSVGDWETKIYENNDTF